LIERSLVLRAVLHHQLEVVDACRTGLATRSSRPSGSCDLGAGLSSTTAGRTRWPSAGAQMVVWRYQSIVSRRIVGLNFRHRSIVAMVLWICRRDSSQRQVRRVLQEISASRDGSSGTVVASRYRRGGSRECHTTEVRVAVRRCRPSTGSRWRPHRAALSCAFHGPSRQSTGRECSWLTGRRNGAETK